jgi:hypothetical protein
MGMTAAADLAGSPLVGALWETTVFTEFQRLLNAGIGAWQLCSWRDRAKEADFLLHRAGRFALADAKWTEHPSDVGRLLEIREELSPASALAVVCRTPNSYPLGNDASALPLAELSGFLEESRVE